MMKQPVLRPSIPARSIFAQALAWLTQTGKTYREERIHDRMMEKKRRGGRNNKALVGYRRKKRLRKIARLSRRKNRQVAR